RNSAGFSPGFPMRVRKLELRRGLYDNSVNNLRVHANGGTILRDSGTIAATPVIFNSINVVYTGPQAFLSGPELPEATPADYTRLRSLTLTDGASLTLSKDIFCVRNLYLDGGTVSTGAFSMGVKDTAFRYSGHVIGNYYAVFDTLNTVETCPVGTANGYTPVTVALDTVYGEGALMVLVTEGVSPRPDSAQNTLLRWWTLSPYPLLPLAFDSAALTFSYLDADFNTGLTPADEGGMVVGKYDTGWTLPAVTGRDTANNAITVGGIASFSEFVVARDQASLDTTGASGTGGGPGEPRRTAYFGAARPNPASGPVTIPFGIDRPAAVRVAVYNAAGQRVRVLVDRTLGPGEHLASWDGRDGRGRPATAGVYFCRLAAGDRTAVRRVTLVR
ncbi:MAG: T9SS type A sorting domain-containing protein, partial [Candidatus Edwardsbacteria bacterium]|nr:T9SS type A sorting domain-containing protein [Candidatus Edwardsbacteria bacterium]